ncbi:3-hydroxybutyrate oligomer hydrolase family protein [Stenotrophomonas mori]|uniref:D-(-)-3-hydroxybutyrate oligomer hydrolase n=1 Tax=Stenotrophomonas mori TaxID=2871096 RepID=A0ABT0SCM4_9GAMM|nr:3-hydroxybutyrate oligomer hydrolase family protein [Stenotrophomonas mori]MCL7713072.1 D-(-)-3-hydroxybutyrate oligomer hydrolase [Stenotrophomonas mori]
MNACLLRAACGLIVGLGLAACAGGPASTSTEPSMFSHELRSEHRGTDDLLTAGLGQAGLRSPVPPGFADPSAPTLEELRRRALWGSWRGIADLAPGGGYGELFGTLAPVPGREYAAYARLPGAHQPHRVLAQVPDAFDTGKRCVLVAPASGSRGVYGAVSVAAAWGLPKGCAVVYTDKGAGSDYFDLDTLSGVRANGMVGALGEVDDLAFVPDAPVNASGVAFKHAHSKDNPEADWGRHVKQAAEYALLALDQAFPQAAPFTFDNTRIIAVGISNGGGAVLQAAALEGDWLDAVVAGEPSVLSDGPGARALYDYATEAALLMPCAQLHMTDLPQPPLTAALQAGALVRCASLATEGVIGGATPAAQARAAYERMLDKGWTDAALRAGALSTGFDLWRAVAVAYASAYGRYGVGEHPCGYGFAAQNPDFSPRPATAAERAAWIADGGGIPPGAGVGLLDSRLQLPDLTYAGLKCLRGLWEGQDAAARRVQAGIQATRTGLPRAGLPVMVVHGSDDGLIPPAFSSTPYVTAAQAAGREVRYWQVRNVQHFDGFLGLPDYAARYLPLLPYVYAALDRVQARLDEGTPLPDDAVLQTRPRAGAPLSAGHLALPR